MSTNQFIIDQLSELAEIYEAKSDKFRALSYRKACEILIDHPEIEDETDLVKIKKLPGIGKGIFEKISEIVNTGGLAKLDELKKDDSLIIIKKFMEIHGIGAKTAQKWYDAGYRTFDDVLKHVKLTAIQKTAIQFKNDANLRIPYKEVTEIFNYINEKAKTIIKDIEIVPCGSYRRGLETCGDIDLLITHVSFEDRSDMKAAEEFGEKLLNKISGIITGKLNNSKTNFMGFCKLLTINRRIDIKIYPYVEYPYALLYFTGSANFGKRIRGLAKENGMLLSDNGLFRDGKLISDDVCTEEDIFKLLKLEYVEPKDRIS